MPRNSKKGSQHNAASSQRTPARTARLILGVLLGLNLVAAGLVLYPPGGSAEALEQEIVGLQAQVKNGRVRVDKTRIQASSVEKGRSEADEFLKSYFVPRRELPSTLLAELNELSDKAKIKDPGTNYVIEKIDGSENLSMVTITANFTGTYRNLLDFVRQVDRSGSFLIIESLNATPQPNSNILTIAMKMEAFMRDDGAPIEIAAAEAAK